MAGKNKESRIHLFYKVDTASATCIKRECPRCGKGVFMAEHKDRLTCGKCGFTEYKQKKVQ